MEVLRHSRCTAGLLTPLPKASNIAAYRQDPIQHTLVLLSLDSAELSTDGLRAHGQAEKGRSLFCLVLRSSCKWSSVCHFTHQDPGGGWAGPQR